jgi:hypothetical protein
MYIYILCLPTTTTTTTTTPNDNHNDNLDLQRRQPLIYLYSSAHLYLLPFKSLMSLFFLSRDKALGSEALVLPLLPLIFTSSVALTTRSYHRISLFPFANPVYGGKRLFFFIYCNNTAYVVSYHLYLFLSQIKSISFSRFFYFLVNTTPLPYWYHLHFYENHGKCHVLHHHFLSPVNVHFFCRMILVSDTSYQTVPNKI